MKTIIKRGTVIPAKKTFTFTTYHDQQTSVNINVFEGERALVKNNHQRGQFNLTGLQPAKRGVNQIEITMEIDENSVLSVTAIDKKTRNKGSITVSNEKGRLTKE